MSRIPENIYIVGVGAIGKALAVLLKQSGRHVTLVRGSVRESLNYEEEIELHAEGADRAIAHVNVCSVANLPAGEGVVVLTNKSYGNTALAEILKPTAQRWPLVILQNGLGVENPFLDAGFSNVFRCVLFATSQVNEKYVRFKPVAPSAIGIVRGDHDMLHQIVSLLHTDVFPFRAEENIQSVIWKKAIVNCVFNSICPLVEEHNGIFFRNEIALAVAKRIITECVAIANAKAVALSYDEVLQSLLLISKLSDGQLISTLQDIRSKRETEIDTLNFEIVRIATSLGLKHEVKETQLLGELTRLKAELTRKEIETVN